MRRDGFTMIELVAGLALVGIVLLLAGGLLSDVTRRSRELRRRAERRGQEGRASEWLRAAFSSLQVGLAGDDVFRGEPESVLFTARLQTANGWFEPKSVKLEISGDELIGVVGTRDSVRLLDRVRSVEAHYLSGYGARSEWLRGWRSPATAPLAVRLVIVRLEAGDVGERTDTLLLLIGPRA